MKHTIFNTPLITPALSIAAKLLLTLTKWKVSGDAPRLARYILVGAPHTSRLDFVFAMSIALATRTECYWVAKHALFWGPMHFVLRWLGGIPHDKKARAERNSLVEQTVCVFKQHRKFALLIYPEGDEQTRWHSGFYHIAKNAEIPIVLGFLDYRTKQGGFGPTLVPSHDMEKDLCEIQGFYENIEGRHTKCTNLLISKDG